MKTKIKFLAALLLALVLGCFCYIYFFGDTYRVYIDDSFGYDVSYENVQVSYGRDGVVTTTKMERRNNALMITFRAMKEGSTDVTVSYRLKSVDLPKDVDGYRSKSTILHVTPLSVITEGEAGLGNFTGHEWIVFSAAVMFLAIAGTMLQEFKRELRAAEYTYQMMAHLSILLFAFVLSIFFVVQFVWCINAQGSHNLYAVYSNLHSLALIFGICTTPIVAFYMVSLVLSNLILMKNEGTRMVNFYGLLISLVSTCAIVIGTVVIYQIGSRIGDEIDMAAATLYSYMECVLLSAAFCCVMAAKHKPRYNKDFIIVPGCGLTENGSMVPLLQERVDQAIDFSLEQCRQDGKKTTFILSGGKRTEAGISEAEAMEEYLFSQGIPKEQMMLEINSSNTYENMKYSRRMMDQAGLEGKVMFVTTDYHVFRNGIIAGESGLDAEGMGSRTKWYFWPNAFAREFFGFFLKEKASQGILMMVMIVIASALGWGFGNY